MLFVPCRSSFASESFVQVVEIRHVAGELRIHQLRDHLLAEAADVHRAATA